MKSKGKTYILLVAVLGIWGTIGYKIISGMSSDDEAIVEEDFQVSFKPTIKTDIDTFSIAAVTRDPFLGVMVTKSSQQTKRTVKSKVTVPLRLPQMSYHGMIQKQNADGVIYVVTINQRQHLFKKGQMIDSVKLIKGTQKEVQVRYKKSTLTLKRQ